MTAGRVCRDRRDDLMPRHKCIILLYYCYYYLLLYFHCNEHKTVYVYLCTQTPSVRMRRLQCVLVIKRVDL